MPPFGKPFHYTESLEFASDKRPWWKFWGKKKHPVAWLAGGRAVDDPAVSAYMLTNEGEVRISPIEAAGLVPLYDQDAVDEAIIAQEDDNAR